MMPMSESGTSEDMNERMGMPEEEEMEEDMGMEDEEDEGGYMEKSDDGQDDHGGFRP
jgi:hypothetical protein